MIQSKINEVIKRLGKVEKDGNNTFSRYKYISAEQINGLLRDILPEVGLNIKSEVTDSSETNFPSKDGKTVIRTVVMMLFTITDTDGGDKVEVRFGGADQDTGGKSYGQAVTEATKRFQLKNFFISDKDDPDKGTVEIDKRLPPKSEKLTVSDAFSLIGVDRFMLETRVKNVDNLTAIEKNDLDAVYRAIKSGENPNQYFVASGHR